MERARHGYCYFDPDRSYARGYEGELERQREAEIAKERSRVLAEQAARRRREELEQWEDDA
jgi:hypothetical protein